MCAIAQLRRTAGKAAQDARATAAGRSVQLARSLGKLNARWHAEVDPFGPAAAPWQHHAVGWTGGWRLHAATQSYLAAPAASATGTGLMLPRSTSRYNVCVIWSCLLVSGHASGRVACGAFYLLGILGALPLRPCLPWLWLAPWLSTHPFGRLWRITPCSQAATGSRLGQTLCTY